MRRCGRCRTDKPLDAFNVRQSWCRECHAEYSREYNRRKHELAREQAAEVVTIEELARRRGVVAGVKVHAVPAPAAPPPPEPTPAAKFWALLGGMRAGRIAAGAGTLERLAALAEEAGWRPRD